ncbi:MAG: DUF1638 domain-containing protein [Candidatus Riflebacteria bacterium]|nr:DUF1638 domain-containing protein [Candidatus Riflebacteria bacterium]
MEELIRLGKISGQLRFLNSMLHMVPQKMETILTSALKEALPRKICLVLVYGDCCPRMLDLVRNFHIGRVDAINCAQLLVGRARYRELMQMESFMILPEWAGRWREIMQSELGLTENVAHELMGENRRELVYLDTGLIPVLETALKDCASFTGLPWRVESVTLDNLLKQLLIAQTTAQAMMFSNEN